MTSNPLPKHGPRKPGSVGRATGTVKVAILDDACNVRAWVCCVVGRRRI